MEEKSDNEYDDDNDHSMRKLCGERASCQLNNEIRNIGFDFDGVLHVNVGPDNGTHSRSPLPFTANAHYHLYHEVINKIKNYFYKYNNNIYIITARRKKKPIYDFLL